MSVFYFRGYETESDRTDDFARSPVFSCAIFCNRYSGSRQRRFTMILNFGLRQLSTIFCCSLLLDLQKMTLLIAQKIMLFSKY